MASAADAELVLKLYELRQEETLRNARRFLVWEFNPKTVEELIALPVFGGRNQRRSAATWLAALQTARESQDPPEDTEPPNGPPPPARWSRRKPEAAARLEAARAGLSELSERVKIPTENLVSPDLVRRLCWDWADPADPLEAVEEFLCAGHARAWQRELVDPVLASALQPPANAEDPDA